MLLDRTGSLRENRACIGAYKPYRANHDHQNDSQHHCVLSDVLPLFVPKDFDNGELHVEPRVSWGLRFGKQECLRSAYMSTPQKAKAQCLTLQRGGIGPAYAARKGDLPTTRNSSSSCPAVHHCVTGLRQVGSNEFNGDFSTTMLGGRVWLRSGALCTQLSIGVELAMSWRRP